MRGAGRCARPPAVAQTTYTWNAATASLWGAPANWTPAPGATAQVTFQNAATLRLTGSGTSIAAGTFIRAIDTSTNIERPCTK